MRSNDLSATEWTVARKAEQRVAHSGEWLAARAAELATCLPAGPLTLLAMSSQGVALAAVIAATRAAPTTWRVANLAGRTTVDGAVAVVEAVQLSPGVRAGLQEKFPGVIILDASSVPVAMAA